VVHSYVDTESLLTVHCWQVKLLHTLLWVCIVSHTVPVLEQTLQKIFVQWQHSARSKSPL